MGYDGQRIGTDMGYRDDFYDVRNIFGYTGPLQDDPTVYFETSTEFGHITQDHRKDENKGRELVRSAAGYTRGNEEIDLADHFVERVNGRRIHKSRDMLFEVKQTATDTLALLAQAITKFTELKPKYGGSVAEVGPGPEQDDEA